MIVAQWSLVEGAMAEHYGLSLRDIWTMSWRRFRVLYEHLFVAGHLTRVDRRDEASQPLPTQSMTSFDPINDWNRLVGKSPPDAVKRLSFDEFTSNFGVKRRAV